MNAVVVDLQTLFESGSFGGLSDGQLLDRFVERKEGPVFEAIVRRHGPMVWGVCRRVLRDHHDAEDAFQATFLVLARKATSVMPREKIGNWLYGVAYQTARKARAVRARRRARESQVSDMPQTEAVSHDLRNELAERLDAELSCLPEKYRVPIVLCDLEGLAHKEAARQLGWPIGTVSSRLSRARSMLAKRLGRRGVTLPVGSLAVLLAQESASAGMPTQLICPTAKAASLFAAGGAATAGVVSAEVVSLVGEVLKAMLLGRLKVALAMLLLASATVLALVPSAAQPDAPAVRDAAKGGPSDRPETDVARSPLPPRALARIGTDLLRTPGNIRSFALSPGGRLVAAGDLRAPSARITIFDVPTGRSSGRFVAPGNGRGRGWVESAAFSPDGTMLLCGEMDGHVTMWDLSTDRLLFRQKLHQGNVTLVAFSPDGRLFVSSAHDMAVRLRRVEKPEEVVREFLTPPALNPRDGREAGRKSAKELLQQLDQLEQLARTDRPLAEAKVAQLERRGPGGIGHLAFTPDSTRLVAGDSKIVMISVWRVNDGRLLCQIGPSASDSMTSMAVAPDGRRIITAGYRQVPPEEAVRLTGSPQLERTEIRLWDIETGERLQDLNGAEESGHADVAISPDGRNMAVVNFSGLRLVDVSTLKPQWTIDLPGWWSRPVAFSSDSRLVALPEQNAVAIFEVATGRRLHHDETTPVGQVGAVGWSPSGDRIVTGHSDGFVRVWDAATGKLIWPKRLAPIIRPGAPAAAPDHAGFSRNGKLLLAAGHRDLASDTGKGIVVVYQAATGEVAREIPRGWIRLAVLAPDGRMVVVADDVNIVGIEAVTGHPRWRTPTVNKPDTYVQPAALQFEANPRWFDAALKDGNVIRFNVLTGHEQRRFLADGRTPEQRKAARPGDPVLSAAAFSADGRTMASFSQGWISLWDVEAGTLRRRIKYPRADGSLLALAPDGKTLAATDVRTDEDFGGGEIRLYDVETGDLVLTLEPGDDRADVLAFSPDGTRLLTGSERGSAIVWDVRRGQGPSRQKE
jgi:RNA polymerase sigma factor (sigma-70 family)